MRDRERLFGRRRVLQRGLHLDEGLFALLQIDAGITRAACPAAGGSVARATSTQRDGQHDEQSQHSERHTREQVRPLHPSHNHPNEDEPLGVALPTRVSRRAVGLSIVALAIDEFNVWPTAIGWTIGAMAASLFFRDYKRRRFLEHHEKKWKKEREKDQSRDPRRFP